MAAVIGFGAISVPDLVGFGSYSVADAATTVYAPTANKKSATYTLSGSMKVTLSCKTEGATVYYSLNGSSYKTYTGAIKISKNSTLKVYSKKSGVKSSVKTYTYKLTPKITISPNGGTYNGSQTIKLSSPVSGVKYYYTTDGSAPTKSSNLYKSTGIKISKSCKLRILAVKSGWTSRSITKNYTIKTASENTSTSNSSESLLENYTEKWAYNQLNSEQKKAYGRLFDAASKHEEKIDVSDLDITWNEFDVAYWAFDYDNPQFLALGSGYGNSTSTKTTTKGGVVVSKTVTRTVTINYGRSASEIAPVQEKFDATTAKILAKADTLKSDYEKIKYFHDWIINNTKYTSNGPAYKSEADGPIVYGKALCEGYSKAFMYLCQSADIPCVCVVSSNHMWNMVKLNGKWYNVDVTWDDPVMSDGSNALEYDYFLKSTKSIADSDHRSVTKFAIPSATSNYK